MTRISVIGLGSMGSGMARALIAAEHEVHGLDTQPARVAELVKAGGIAASLPDSARSSEIVVCVVLNATQTEAVLFGPDGWASHLRPGTVIVSCATVAPEDARGFEISARKAGLLYLDAPISGGAVRAAQGQLSIMASGADAAFDAALPALQAMAMTLHRLGERAGAGSAMKSVNQMLAGIHIAAMGEALAFAIAQGLDLGRVVEVISASAGTSWMFENRAPHVLAGDYQPRSTVDIWPKDLGIVEAMADAAGMPIPMTQAALRQFRAAAAAGDGQRDDAAVIKVYARAAGLPLPGEA